MSKREEGVTNGRRVQSTGEHGVILIQGNIRFPKPNMNHRKLECLLSVKSARTQPKSSWGRGHAAQLEAKDKQQSTDRPSVGRQTGTH